MINNKFEVYKLVREIKRSGIEVEFKRHGLNEFKEPDGTQVDVGSVRGIYHEQNSSIQIVTGETTQIRNKKIPMFLCTFESVDKLSLDVGDYFILNGKTFKVTGTTNIQEWNIITDISLEVVDDGKS